MGNEENKKEKQFFDKSYKYLFQHKKFIRSLIQLSLPGELVKCINWNTFKSEKTDFVSKDLKSKFADAIFGIKLKNKEDIYVFFLIEFQVSIDYLMALRVEIYRYLFYHHLLKTGRIKENAREIPFTLSVVLYIGDKPWDAGTRLSSLLNKDVYKIVKRYVPQNEFLLIDKNRYSFKELMKMKNSVTGLLYLEKIGEKDIKKHVTEFLEVFSKGTGKEQFTLLTEYFVAMIKHKYGKKVNIEINPEQEVIDMGLAAAIDKCQEKNREEGMRKGIRKGKREGRMKGKIESAKKMLEEGFDIQFVMKITGLNKSQIMRLKTSKKRKA